MTIKSFQDSNVSRFLGIKSEINHYQTQSASSAGSTEQCSHLFALFALFDDFQKMNCSHCSLFTLFGAKSANERTANTSVRSSVDPAVRNCIIMI